MKQKSILLLFIACIIVSMFFDLQPPHELNTANYAALVNTSGAPAGKSGAPGEGNCTMCHAGSVNDGSTSSSITYNGSNSEYTPGDTYNMTLSITNGAVKNGFQLVVIDSIIEENAGNINVTDTVNTQLISANNRDYLNHTSSGTMENSWNFEWTAPANDIGPIVFYYAYNVTNNALNTDGDNIYLSQVTLYPSNTSPVCDSKCFDFDCYVWSNNKLAIETNYLVKTPLSITLFDLQGKEAFSKEISISEKTMEVIIPNNILKGIYIISLKSNSFHQAKKVTIGF